MSTAAVVIIGNEILSGKFPDENGPFLITRLRALGVDLLRLVVIPDEIPEIAAEVGACSARYDFVYTTGGVGPTHDDLTMPGVAAAFDVPLVRQPELASIIAAKLGPDAPPAALRMADVPEGADLWWDGGVRFPLVVMRNVAIFPGVPALLKLKFDAAAHRWSGTPVGVRRIWTERDEPAIADALTDATARWATVAIGSYPRFELSPPRVLVTLESRDPDALAACSAWVSARIGAVSGA